MDNSSTTHVTKRFLEYQEKSISGEALGAIERHLAECSQCSAYYRVMGEALGVVNRSSIYEIEPDPYLPVRVKSIVESPKRRNGKFTVVVFAKMLAAAGAFSIAVTIGIVLGKGIATEQKTAYSSSMATTYIDAFRQYGFGDHLEYTFNSTQVKQ